ncbi:hypothetical protein [Xanthomonas axonopodis]|nr:hypothetical protein [Xanthomonas axonopodis]
MDSKIGKRGRQTLARNRRQVSVAPGRRANLCLPTADTDRTGVAVSAAV